MNSLFKKIELIDNNYFYSSIFRLYLSIHIFKRYLFLFLNKDLLINYISNESPDLLLYYLGFNSKIFTDEIIVNVFFSGIFILCVFFLFGIFKYITPFLLYILIEITQRNFGLILNGGDNYLKFALLYMCFANSYTRFNLFGKLNPQPNSIVELLNKLSVLSIKIHLCLIYFITGIFKINSKVWFSGVATYYTLNLERFKATSYNEIISKNGYFVTISTYLTLFWELTFPFAVWLKKIKYYYFFIGIIIHLGIFIFMMIHEFEILFIMSYGFFISDKEWTKIINYFKRFFQHDD